MKSGYKWAVAFSCLALVCCSFYIGYFGTLKSSGSQSAQKKPAPADVSGSGDEAVELLSREVRITDATVLEKKVESINTGASRVEYSGKVPDILVGYTKAQTSDYFKNYGTVKEFGKDRISVVRRLPNLPNCYLLKLEGDYMVIYSTDNDGVQKRYGEPIPCGNRDENLERGIEKDTLDEIYEIIEDYN